MEKEIELCRPCAETLAAEYDLTPLVKGVDRKITCENCGKRRYGTRFAVDFTTSKSRRNKKHE